jgi:hypothetical protein
MNSRTPLRVLFIALEFPRWRSARPWSYAAQLGFEEGFKANGVDVLTITTQWLSRAREICAGKRFDQVWVELVHNDLDPKFLEWLATLAPVRIGILFESLHYTPYELETNSTLQGRRELVEERLKYVTHAIAVDEEDAADINRGGAVRGFWCPSAVPERFIVEKIFPASRNYAVFSGSVYGPRAIFLNHPSLQGLLVHQSTPDLHTVHHGLFDMDQLAARLLMPFPWQIARVAMPGYLAALRYTRRYNYALYLHSLQTSSAIVNLPAYVKGYASRVLEGMAVGRPVISQEIPDRPRNKNLFQDGQEILLYSASEPEQLAEQIRHVLTDSQYASSIVANASCKLKRLHTLELRINQILKWIESGEEPDFG